MKEELHRKEANGTNKAVLINHTSRFKVMNTVELRMMRYETKSGQWAGK